MKRCHAYVLLGVVLLTSTGAAEPGGRRRRPPPSEFGQVVIANRSEAAHLAPVVFDHWVHRARYTCRLCHVDVAFAMRAGATNIRAVDNMKGQYCGACHDGKRAFASCAEPQGTESRPACLRCHAYGKPGARDAAFAAFAAKLPRGRFGNGIDWEEAERQKLLKPADFLEGISIRRKSITAQKDFALSPRLETMPEIIFSHAKHTFWNGCELCHPDIFAVKRGVTKYTMVQIFQGESCGACHVSVAFPLIDCQRCHSSPVQ